MALDWSDAAFLLPSAVYVVWVLAARLLRRWKRNRFRAAGMDAELSGRLAKDVPLRQLPAALAHWRDPDTVVQWLEQGQFQLCRDGFFYWTRRLTLDEKLKLAQRRPQSRFRLPWRSRPDMR